MAPKSAPVIVFAKDPFDGDTSGLAEARGFMSEFSSKMPPGTKVSDLKTKATLGVYNLGVNAISSDTSWDTLPSAQLFYELELSGNPVSWVKVNVSADSMYPMQYFFGNESDIFSALDRLYSLPELQDGGYEARLLVVQPGLRNFGGNSGNAIWLKSTTNGADYVFTTSSFPNARVGANKLYAVPDFLAVLKGLLPATRGRANRSPAGN